MQKDKNGSLTTRKRGGKEALRLKFLRDLLSSSDSSPEAKTASLLAFGCADFPFDCGVLTHVSDGGHRVVQAFPVGGHFQTGDRFPDAEARLAAPGKAQDALAVPITVAGKLAGGLFFLGPKPGKRASTEADGYLLDAMAAWLGQEWERQEERQDISQRRLTEQNLRLSGKLFEVCSEAVMITDAGGIIISVNPAFTWLTGYRPDEVVGLTPRLLKSGVHDDDFYRGLWSELLDKGCWSGEIWDRRKNGSVYPKWLTINAVWENGRMTHFVSLFHDISESKAHESRIRHLAEHDALTGLPNRRILEARVAQLIASERRADQGFALILIDLDHFKNINDSMGHMAGDQVLIEVARRLVQGVRSTDTVVRLGGDEFVIVLAGISDPAGLADILGKIHRMLGQPICLQGRALHAPPSMGIALYPGDGEDIETLLRNADAAMYQTKTRGRNGWNFYTADMNRHLAERLSLEEALRHAMDSDGLAVHFQPLLEMASGRVVSWEALLRWRHPELGEISPERIIPIAEESGLIHSLGRWIIRTACLEARRWEDEGLGQFRVSVNISPIQLEQEELGEAVWSALQEAGLDSGRLELEIAESALARCSPTAAATLENLRRGGVLLALDDFGTEYSALGYLKNLSVRRVKINRSFVRNVATDLGDASIVQAIVSLARSLNLKVVAEGVETTEQHSFLLRSGCAEIQGFLLGHPMPSAAIGDFLDSLASSRLEKTRF